MNLCLIHPCAHRNDYSLLPYLKRANDVFNHSMLRLISVHRSFVRVYMYASVYRMKEVEKSSSFKQNVLIGTRRSKQLFISKRNADEGLLITSAIGMMF